MGCGSHPVYFSNVVELSFLSWTIGNTIALVCFVSFLAANLIELYIGI